MEHYTHEHVGMIAGVNDLQRIDYLIVLSPKIRDNMRILFYRGCDKLILPKEAVLHKPIATDPAHDKLRCMQCQLCKLRLLPRWVLSS